jgi:hypothetical protein
MFHLLHIFLGISLGFGAIYINRLVSAQAAKKFCVHFSFALVIFTTLASLLFHGAQPLNLAVGNYTFTTLNRLPWIELFLGISLLIAVSFASIKHHSVSTFKAIVILMALMQLMFASNLWPIILLASSASAIYAIIFLRSISTQHANIFSLYQLLAISCLITGLCLIKLTNWAQLGMALVCLSVALRQGLFPFQSAHIYFLEKIPFGFGFLNSILHLGIIGFLATEALAWSDSMLKLVALCAGITSLCAAALSLNQKDGKKSLSYLLLSQSGLMTFAWATNHGQLSTNLLIMWYSTAIATLGFTGLLHSLEARRGHLSLITGSGNFAHTPKLASYSLMLGLASVGFPLTLGFEAIEDIFLHSFSTAPWLTMLCVLSVSINSINVLRLFFMLFTGRRKNTHEPDLTANENFTAALNTMIVFAGALIPYPLIATLG